jgi:uncharacterized protein YbjT (DUF2867 family)
MNLVIGASGVLGSRIVERLLHKNLPVRAVSRNPDKLERLKSKSVDLLQGDLRDPSWMDIALRGVKNLFLATHGLVPPTRKNNIILVDDAGNRRIIDAAKRAGVEQVIFTSALLAHPESPATFGKIKYKIEEYLKKSGLKYTIIRPTAFIETHGLFLIGEPLRHSGKVSFLGTGAKPIHWISAVDAAEYMVQCIDNPEFQNTVKSITGPDVMSRVQVLEIFERVLDKKAKRSHLPIGAVRIMRHLLKPFNPGIGYLFEVVIAEEDPALSETPGQYKFDWTAPQSVEDVVQRWAGKIQKAPA